MKRAEYPWQLELPPWSPGAGASEAERRRRCCRTLFEIEQVLRDAGLEDPDFVYDPDHGLYRFPDGRFALSREHVDWRTLKDAGFFE